MSRFHDFFTVAKFTIKDFTSRKSFRISTLLILIFIIGGISLFGYLTKVDHSEMRDTILVSDQENVFGGELPKLNNEDLNFKFENTELDFEGIKSKLESGDAASALEISTLDDRILITYITNNTAVLDNAPSEIVELLNSVYLNQQLAKLNLSETELASLNPNFEFQLRQTDDQEIGGNIFVMMILSVILFFAIYFCAFQVSNSITVEKTSKIMETLVTSTSPRTIIIGKTVGIGLVGLAQIVLFALTAIITAKASLDSEVLTQMFDLSNFTPFLIIMSLLYFILGYFAYAFLYALTGSTVSKPEDVQSANMPVALITMVGFYLAYFTLTDPTSSLSTFAAILPISSPFCMPVRIMMGVASVWEIVLSVLALIIFCMLIAKIAIKIYSNAILNYGSRMTLADIIKAYKNDK